MRLPADERRQQLLEVACDLFARSGFHDTSMDEIAEGAGVTKPVLYQHFPSKKALYGELLEDTGRRLLDHLARATSRATSGRERVEAGFRAYFQFAVGDRSSFRLLFGASIRSDPDFARTVDAVLRAASDTISDLIEIPASDEQRRVLASALGRYGRSGGPARAHRAGGRRRRARAVDRRVRVVRPPRRARRRTDRALHLSQR